MQLVLICKGALRKESVDRNANANPPKTWGAQSLSARRAWIEICHTNGECGPRPVALRKESVDRNRIGGARQMAVYVALRKESVDRNNVTAGNVFADFGRSPQGERG